MLYNVSSEYIIHEMYSLYTFLMENLKKSYRHGNLAEALVTDALVLLETQSADELSIRVLADRAGVSPRAPYVHFPTKSDLLFAIADRGFQMLIDDSAAAGDEIASIGRAYIGLAVRHPNLFRLMFSGMVAQEKKCGSAGDSYEQLMNAISKANPNWGEAEIMQAAVSLWALVHGIADLRIEGLIPDETWETLSLEMMASYIGTIVAGDG